MARAVGGMEVTVDLVVAKVVVMVEVVTAVEGKAAARVAAARAVGVRAAAALVHSSQRFASLPAR